MRKIGVLFIFIFAIAIIMGLLMSQSLVVMQRIAHVSNVAGWVQVKSRTDSDFKPLAGAEYVRAGDTLSTGAQASLALNWLDGTRIRVGPSTVITVLKCQLNKSTQTETSLFKLDVGQIWIRILKVLTQQSKFEIRTPTATAGVRGTIFSVQVTPDGNTEVSVYEGTVSVQSASGPVEVAENSVALLGSSETVAQVLDLTPEDRRGWDNALDDLGPYLQITHPGPDETISSDSVSVSGICEQGATVTVNDQSVTPRLNGRFSIQLPLSPQQHALTIRAVATDAQGHTTTVTRELQRISPPSD